MVDVVYDLDLFCVCCGVGGGNFGVIMGYIFVKLFEVLQEVVFVIVVFDWVIMMLQCFVELLCIYGEYWEMCGKDLDMWGMFLLFKFMYKLLGQIVLFMQFCNLDGMCCDFFIFNDFLNCFQVCVLMLVKGCLFGYGFVYRQGVG